MKNITARIQENCLVKVKKKKERKKEKGEGKERKCIREATP
jgi:hypothetical protein